MTLDELYQKKHGLPGVPFISGTTGHDGEGGNNVYFGYINEFFDTIKIDSDNLVRIATDSSNCWYTGVFKKESDGTFTPSRWWRENYDASVDNVSSGLSMEIMADPSTDRWKYSFGDGKTSRMYVKVDVNETGKDTSGNSQPWNLSEKDGSIYWRDTTLDGSSFKPGMYPYVKYKGQMISDTSLDIHANVRPGKYSLSQSDLNGFELFSINTGNAVYQFAYVDDVSREYDSSNYTFNDDSSHNIDDPSITEVGIADVSSTGYSLKVDYIKYSENMSENIEFVNRLKTDIVAGDVIYFYTNKDLFNIDETIQYMTVITPALERCTYDELIAASVEQNPLSFKFIQSQKKDGSQYLLATQPVVSGYYNTQNSSRDVVKAYGRNMVNMLDSIGNTTVYQAGSITQQKQSETGEFTDEFTDNIVTCIGGDSSLGFSIEYQNTGDDVKSSASISLKAKNFNPKLKIANAYFRNANVGNLETNSATAPSNLIMDENGNVHTPVIADFNPDTKMFTFTKDQFISDGASLWRAGAVCVTFDMRTGVTPESVVAMQNVTTRQKQFFWNEQTKDDMNIILTDDYGQWTSHIIMLWASVKGGSKHYSQRTLAQFSTASNSYDIGSFDEIASKIEPEKPVFTVSSLSASAQNNVVIDIRIPCDDETLPFKVFINTSEITSKPYSDSWASVNISSKEVKDGYRKIRLSAQIKANLPKEFGNFDNVMDYNASPGEDNVVSGCTLFQSILAGNKVKSEPRSFNVSVNYTYAGEKHVGYTKVTQPGYEDPRTIPNVSIDIIKDLKSLEESNRSDLGVTSNQFQFFVEVSVDDFDRSKWGSFVSEDDITLDMTIRNSKVDYKDVVKYGIQLVQDTKTLHVNPVEKEEDNDKDFENNYVRFHTYVAAPKMGSMLGKTQAELDLEDSQTRDDETLQISAKDVITLTNSSDEPFEVKDKDGNIIETYYPMSKDVFNSNDYDYRPYGVQDDICFEIKGAKFSDVRDGKFRFRVVTEMSNPLFSLLFFRFYVSEMCINYRKNNKNNTFHVGTSNLASKSNVGNQTTYQYMFSSETFKTYICPVSLVSIPDDKKVEPVIVRDYMTGDRQQLLLKTSVYVPDSVLKENETLLQDERTNRYIKQQSLGWFDFSLKKKYFQDSVNEMKIMPVATDNIIDNLSVYEIANTVDPSTGMTLFESMQSVRHDLNYMSVIYNADMLGAKKRQDTSTFYYNSVIYDAAKYSQKSELSPVMTEQTVRCEVRDSSLSKSVQTWNKWFQDSPVENSGLFRGTLAAYGNGYVYLTEKPDENLVNVAKQKEVYTPSVTKELSEEKVPYVNYMTAGQPEGMNRAPGSGAWFRTLLYQSAWQYPKYYTVDYTQTRQVDLYNIVPVGEYMKKPVGKDDEFRIVPKVPYNIMYSIYPRCAYDSDNDTAICFMLRCPSVTKENKYKMDSEDVKFEHADYKPLWNVGLFPAD